MTTSRAARSNSLDSHDMHGESDLDPEEALPSEAGPSRRKGKGKVTKETDRKAQNRIAQREFRQRKQAYIKELEAKVKLQELGRDEQIERLTDAVKVLLKENDNLRQMLAGLSGFIGEGLGGVLPRLKTTLPEFEAMLSRSQVDSATGALRLDDPGISSTKTNDTNHRRLPSEPEVQVPPLGRPTHYSTYPPATSYPVAEGARLPDPSPTSPPPISHPLRTTSGPAAYSSVPTSHPSISSPLSTYSYPVPPSVNPGSNPSYARTNDSNEHDSHRSGSKVDPKFTNWFLGEMIGGRVEAAEDALMRVGSQHTDNTALQAMQLISYHMASKRKHPDYNLPPSLKATPTQTLVPHSAVFDGIIFPSLRDRLILLKDQYPITELTKDLCEAFSIHGNDLLLAENWELSAEFLKKYWFVIDETVLEISNRWRKERGEPELDMKSIVPDME